MKAYKGFNKDMTCRDFQYKEGEEYETEDARICNTGFHACEHPLDCFGYYEPVTSVYHEVELGGKTDKEGCGDTKIAATKIKIGARLTIAGLVKAAIDFVFARTQPEADTNDPYSATSQTGDRSATSQTGDSSATSQTGDRSATSQTGYRSATSQTGYRSATSQTGDSSATSQTGYRSSVKLHGAFSGAIQTGSKSVGAALHESSIVTMWGREAKAKGVIGAHIVFADWRVVDYDWKFCGAKMVRIDGEEYKADTWYYMKDGKVVEVCDD